MDTLVEYTPILSTLGLTGQDVFALISEGVKATGLDTDKAADMVKEFFLTLTDGSDTSKEAFKDVGINIDTLKNQIDNGSITSAEAMQKVMKAIMKVGDETEQARLLQEIFKGTIEYGSIGVVEAWANMEQGVVNTKGAIDEAKTAFEGSYEASKQDLSNSWNELTTTIGSGTVPALTWVIDLFNDILATVMNLGPLYKNTLALMGNDLSQWSLGAVGKFKEFEIACIEGAIKIAEALGKDEWASKWKENLEGAKQSHSETVKKIIENEKERTRIESEDEILREQIYGKNKESHNSNADKIIKKNEEVKQSSKTTNKAIETDTTNSANKVSANTNKMSTDMSTNMNKAKSSAESSMQGVKGAIDNNMDGSLKTVQVQATEMYKGVKTSFFKMSQSAREDGTEMYKGVQTSAQKMADSAKSSASDMYRGVTTSTSRMADKAIGDWNSIRTAYSKPINGKITKTTINKTKNEKEDKSINNVKSNFDIMPVDDINLPNISNLRLTGGYFTSTATSRLELDNESSILEINKLLKEIIKSLSKNNNSTTNNITINSAKALSPYEIAKENIKAQKRLALDI